MVDIEELPNNPADDLADHTSPPVQEEGYSQAQVPGNMIGLYRGVLMIILSQPDQEQRENQMLKKKTSSMSQVDPSRSESFGGVQQST